MPPGGSGIVDRAINPSMVEGQIEGGVAVRFEVFVVVKLRQENSSIGGWIIV